jgi:hypothetical protein
MGSFGSWPNEMAMLKNFLLAIIHGRKCIILGWTIRQNSSCRSDGFHGRPWHPEFQNKELILFYNCFVFFKM